MFGSEADGLNPNDVDFNDYKADTRAWIKTGLAYSAEPCVWLMGHSEGSMVALLTAQNSRDICGLILLSAVADNFSDVIIKQIEQNPMAVSLAPELKQHFNTLKAGERIDDSDINPMLKPLLGEQIQKFLISAVSFTSSDLIATLPVDKNSQKPMPVLLITGDKDIQTPLDQSQKLHQAYPDSNLHIIPNANHVWKAVMSDNRMQNLMTYGDESLAIKPEFVSIIADFIKKHE